MRRKRAVIGSILIVVGLVGSVVTEAIISGRFEVKLPAAAAPAGSESSGEDKIIIIEKEIPAPTPSPTPEPTATPKTEPVQEPAGDDANQPDGRSVPIQQADGGTERAQPPATPEEPAVPVVTAPPYERPTVEESLPAPAPEPEVEPEPEITSITLDAYDMSLLTGDSWRLSIVSAPASVSSQGAKWVTSNSAVLDLSGPDLSGVTIQAKAAGRATVTIYSRDGQYSAACNVTVS